MHSYGSDNKEEHRIIIANEYKRDHMNERIMYLEAPDGGATKTFVREGIPPRMLLPINNNEYDCKSIREATGVAAECVDIDAKIQSMKHESFSIIWLDYTKRFADPEVIRIALQCSRILHLNLSSSRFPQREMIKIAKDCIAEANGVLQQYTVYKGKSDKMNMVRFKCIPKHVPYHSPKPAMKHKSLSFPPKEEGRRRCAFAVARTQRIAIERTIRKRKIACEQRGLLQPHASRKTKANERWTKERSLGEEYFKDKCLHIPIGEEDFGGAPNTIVKRKCYVFKVKGVESNMLALQGIDKNYQAIRKRNVEHTVPFSDKLFGYLYPTPSAS